MGTFKAIRIDKSEAGYHAAFADFDDADLMDGDVTVRVTHSTVNYKDGLAVTGKSPVVRRFPMIPGIDFADLSRYMAQRVNQHGIRRAAEMREAGMMLDDLGMDGSLARAVADAQERGAGKAGA